MSRRWWNALREAWRTELWPVPSLCVAVAVAMGVALPRLDGRIDDTLPGAMTAYLFSGGPEAARTVLSAVAGSLITVTSLTFSLTVVTLQLASSQYSPRLLRTFTHDRFVHLSLGVLLGTFTYALTVLRTVRASLSEQAAFVPQISVTVAYLLALVSVLTLVVFLAHLSGQIRVEWILRRVHADTTTTMRRVLTEPAGTTTPPPAPDHAVPLCAGRSGFLTWIDEQALLAATVDAAAVVCVDRLPGDSLIAGTPIAHAWSADGAAELSADHRDALTACLHQSVQTGFERTAAQDVAFGLRQLVDVVIKALSPGINDPTTAVHGLGHIAALMCDLAGRDLGPRLLCDEAGQVRVVLRRPDFATLLDLAVAQPCRYGAQEPAVLSRLLVMLREIGWITDDPAQRDAVRTQLDRLTRTIEHHDVDLHDGERLRDEAQRVRYTLAGRWTGTA
ncbi:DUF2254 domain-containing protein [Dactylosporangium matsuzakiense]|uniref:DUF2254 domain-containing protein n=1 Tax=Dactylosporangium matsuzakiense TaxID=53360 RepID=UPI0021C3BFD4|nr:DUF2254 domain-containing protein [Dactylosporangium matsuzakiense]UWZ42216.1 DUF2254 domain-containing protein [Dactylosporangium matsuzakiense]